MHFFGGQPGAGKSWLQGPTVDRLREVAGYSGVAQVVGDELRPYHPEYNDLLRTSDRDAARYTDADSGRWVEKSVDLVVSEGAHLILEGTLRRPEVTIRTAQLCAQHGYQPELHVSAVHQFISRTRIFQRYVGQIRHHGYGRYTTPEAHDLAYRVLPDSLSTLAESRLFQAITLYDANGHALVTTTNDEEAEDRLRSALSLERDAACVDLAQLLGDIASVEASLRSLDRRDPLADLRLLKEEVENERSSRRT